MGEYGYVYLICDPANNTYKIGVTRNLQSNRLKKLQTGNSTELFIMKTYKSKYPFRLETMLHGKFRCKRELNELFNLTCEDIVHFEDTCNELTKIMDCLSDNPFFMKNIK